MRALAILTILCLLPAVSLRAGDKDSPSPPALSPVVIWSGLVLATNDAHPAEPPVQLHALADKLKDIFGYNQFELIGENSQRMGDPNEHWLIPSKDFCLSVKSRAEKNDAFPLKIILFQNRKRLAECESKLTAESPLFIRGPLYAGGQLVIVLAIEDSTGAPTLPAALPVSDAAGSPAPAPAASNGLAK